MNIIISIHNIWANKILSGTKTLEFRNSLPKNIQAGDKVFIYETYFNGGRKSVVGYAKIESFDTIPVKGRIGFCSFLDYYAEKIIKSPEILKRVQRCNSIELPEYDHSIVYKYMFNDEWLDFMEKNKTLPEVNYFNPIHMKYLNSADKLSSECDDWLTNIGYYNEFCESFYKYYIEISNPVRFNFPIPITEFIGKNDKYLAKAPQSWCYTKVN